MTTNRPLPVHPQIRYGLRERCRKGKGTWHLFWGGFHGSLCGLLTLLDGQTGLPTSGAGPVCQKCLQLIPLYGRAMEDYTGAPESLHTNGQ